MIPVFKSLNKRTREAKVKSKTELLQNAIPHNFTMRRKFNVQLW